MGQRALETVHAHRGATERTLKALDQLLGGGTPADKGDVASYVSTHESGETGPAAPQP